MRRVLSNPMDLTLVAAMLGQGQTPDLFHLQQQQYQHMAEDYQRIHVGQVFPLQPFSEQVYQMRLNDQNALSDEKFTKELQCMERHKLMVCRLFEGDAGAHREWHFRHDKIIDFFIVQAFLGPANDRPEKHLGDARFRGVYLQLAMLLPLEDASALERLIIDLCSRHQRPYGERCVYSASALPA